MLAKGFVFSLDAFVAFSLILIAIQSLLAISSAPSGYYLSMQQANYLATGTLSSLSQARVHNGQDSLFDGIIGRDAGTGKLSVSAYNAESLIEATVLAIPEQYSFAYDYYDFSSGEWLMIFNASKECSTEATFGYTRFCNNQFNRVQASSRILMGVYSEPLRIGDSPYCNVNCKGYQPSTGGNTPAAECTSVPCEPYAGTTFEHGDYQIGFMRLTVWG
ncbi:hypothetical protein COU37_04235 [Candidatus Micrarchaeota archaeon CG10_big_fil_rev_8_21_14_0_10_45_29]|nr:MAG: hypothetical protein COU37_04235 [Candidatus Micrarchaeota archaeon CG10_big_fil_rev_8_21_14_0_10_45_29]